jgi:hypothetical protein
LQYNSYIHYNNRKLYNDTLLINDFNLNAGDTFNLYVQDFCQSHNGYYKFPVDYTDSMYYGNKWRKRIVFKQVSGFNFGNPVTWVEGIGDIYHGLAVGGINFYGFVEQATCAGFARLNCFQEQGYAPFGLYCYNGSCTTGIIEIMDGHDISLFPNPTTDNILLENLPSEKITLRITNIFGQVIYFTQLENEQTFFLSLEEQSSGIYFLLLQTQSGFLFNKKIIKQ